MRTRRPEDWAGAVLDRPADEIAAAAAAAGFGAVYVDTHGYADGGAQTLASLSALLGGPQDVMIGELIVQQLSGVLRWGFASALAVILLVVTAALLLVVSRIVNIGKFMGGER